MMCHQPRGNCQKEMRSPIDAVNSEEGLKVDFERNLTIENVDETIYQYCSNSQPRTALKH